MSISGCWPDNGCLREHLSNNFLSLCLEKKEEEVEKEEEGKGIWWRRRKRGRGTFVLRKAEGESGEAPKADT